MSAAVTLLPLFVCVVGHTSVSRIWSILSLCCVLVIVYRLVCVGFVAIVFTSFPLVSRCFPIAFSIVVLGFPPVVKTLEFLLIVDFSKVCFN